MHTPSAPLPPPSGPSVWQPAPFEERFWQWVSMYQPSNDEPESSPALYALLSNPAHSRHNAIRHRGAEALN